METLDILTEKQIKYIYKVATKKSREEYCDEVLLSLLLCTGLALPQIINIKVKDVMSISGELYDTCTYSKKYGINTTDHIFFLTPEWLTNAINRYIKSRQINRHQTTSNLSMYKGLDPNSKLVLNRYGKEFGVNIKRNRIGRENETQVSLQNKVTKWFKEAKIQGKSTKSFKISLAKRLVLSGLTEEKSHLLIQGNTKKLAATFSLIELDHIKLSLTKLYDFINTLTTENQEIFHYCTMESFLAILKSKSLWMSDLLKMNDPNEIIDNIEIAKKSYSSMFENESFNFDTSEIINSELKFLSCSFSKKGDDLNQWRCYSDDGQGICIGFDKLKLQEINNIVETNSPYYLDNEDNLFEIKDVNYQLEKQKKEYQNLWNEIKDKGVESSSYKNMMEMLILNNAIIYKSPYYEDEEEVRIFKKVSLDNSSTLFDKGLDFRVGKYGLTAYSKISFESKDLSPISQIILGPKCKSNVDDIFQLINFLKIPLNKSKIKKSSGSYR